jgi:hypothetical protein
MGLNISVFKDSSSNYDCTAGGITSRFNRLCVVNVNGPFDPTDDTPAVMLVKGNMPGTVKIVPVEELDKGSWTMFGGNYAATSDSRFSQAIEKIVGGRFYGAVPVHDRVEN